MYSAEEDVINSATHFLSAVISVLVTLLVVFNTGLPFSKTFPIFIMGFTSSWTFFSSYLYHSSKQEPKRERNRILDRCSIYTMITGNAVGIALLSSLSTTSIICCIILIIMGSLFVANLCLKKKVSEVFSLTSYLLMGWLAVLPSSGLFFPSKFTDMPELFCLLAGGLSYSLGVIFYTRDRKWDHVIWHIFTMLGFGFHFSGAYICL
tara:strand:+ start:9294 stop:9914 length:621 start_codon:yes stop_codon:yes gene_type:complete